MPSSEFAGTVARFASRKGSAAISSTLTIARSRQLDRSGDVKRLKLAFRLEPSGAVRVASGVDLGGAAAMARFNDRRLELVTMDAGLGYNSRRFPNWATAQAH